MTGGRDENRIHLFAFAIVLLGPFASTQWVHTSLPDTLGVPCFAVSGTNLFAGTEGGVWRRPLLEVITDVKSSTSLPKPFALDQSFPNSFNPRSKIRYHQPALSNSEWQAGRSEFRPVTPAVYDLLGREVAVLVNDRQGQGNYEVKFDGSNLAGGVHFYRLQVGSLAETKKLSLVR